MSTILCSTTTRTSNRTLVRTLDTCPVRALEGGFGLPQTCSLTAEGQVSETLLAHKWVSYIRGTCEGLAEAPTSTEDVAEVLCGLAFAGQRFGSLHLDSWTAARVAYNFLYYTHFSLLFYL
jgi:hypothetical protein